MGSDNEPDSHDAESDCSNAADTHETKATLGKIWDEFVVLTKVYSSRYYQKYHTARREVKRLREARDNLESETGKLCKELNTSQHKLADLQTGFAGLVAQFSDLK